ncbi:MAG: UDP-N-acetylmuramoyl-tripeptide--D-alanyl-D-alanine ligase [Leptospirales bacterium]|nr:UDP-N-acetylmuramoyl-tripeptide--D-alanyl-D-alanine ligase [Leptospirales bacterium]
MRVWSVAEIESVLGNRTRGAGKESVGVSTDSRTLAPGNVFVCLSGDSFDGHAYAAAACEKGATSIIASRSRAAELVESLPKDVNLWLVDDTLQGLSRMASHARDTLKCPVLGVAGSNGKTSTKDMLAGIAKRVFKNSYATSGNLNNHIGLPLTLTNIPVNAQMVILEMGMNHTGELAALSKIARPHHAIVTSVALEHAEFFSSIEDIARAELEIVTGMQGGGLLLYHADSPCTEIAVKVAKEHSLRLKLFKCEDVKVQSSGIEFDFNGKVINNPNYFSRVMAENLLGAILLLEAAGVPAEDLARAAAFARPQARRRFEVFRMQRGNNEILLIDDSYNANEASFVAAIRAMREILPQGRLALCAGEMAELGAIGPDAHRSVGKAAAQMGFSAVFASGTSDAQILLDGYRAHSKEGKTILASEPSKLLEGLNPFEFDGILVKGSRRARMDLVSDALKLNGFVSQAENDV